MPSDGVRMPCEPTVAPADDLRERARRAPAEAAITAPTTTSTTVPFRPIYLARALAVALPAVGSVVAFAGDRRLVGAVGLGYLVLIVGVHHRLAAAMREATSLKHVNAALHEDVRATNERLVDVNLLLRHQAEHDALTGLANRSLAVDTLSRAVRTVGPGACVAVLFCDLDGFKPVNDSFGHQVGDHLLVATARRLRAAVGGDDLVARLGGDEFVIVAAGLAQPSDAVGIAERVLRVMSEPVAVDGHALRVGMSIGVVAADSPRSALELIRLADGALYAAKQRGRGRVEVAQIPARAG